MGTTPIASLPFPELTSPNNPPADIELLANELDPLVKPQIQTFTPAWSQSGGTGLSIGNGTLEGRYVQIGRFVAFHILLVRGSTTNLGTASYVWTGPPPPAVTAQQSPGSAMCSVGGAFKQGVLRMPSSTTFAVLRPDDSGLGPSSFAWAAGDWISLSGVYLSSI